MEPEMDAEELEALEEAIRMNKELKKIEAEMEGRALHLVDESMINQSYRAGASRQMASTTRSRRAAPPPKRTFTSAPPTSKLIRPVGNKAHYTHSNNRLTDIDRQNQLLADKLAEISIQGGDVESRLGGTAGRTPGYLKVATVAPAAVNRKKKMDSAQRENLRLLSRLQSIKPDKSLCRREAEKKFQEHKKHSQNCSKNPKRKVLLERPAWEDVRC